MAAGLTFLWLLAVAGALAEELPLWTSLPTPCPADRLSVIGKDCLVVRVDFAQLTAPDVDLVLPLPDGTVVLASKNVGKQVAERSFIWRGSIRGKSFSRVTFSMFADAVVGTIAFDGQMFRLRTVRNVQIVEEINMAALPRDESVDYRPEPPSANSPPNGGLGGDPPTDMDCGPPDPNRVDVLVLYTPNAMNGAGGSASINAWIDLQVDETNDSLELSKASSRINLVGAELIQYSETSSNFESLARLTEAGDGHLEQAHTRRNQYNADIVALITFQVGAGTSGMANAMRDYHIPDEAFVSFEPLAFAVLDTGTFMTGDFTLAHELGHVMGAQHNRDARDGTTAGAIPDSSYGLMQETMVGACRPWMTIMAVRESADRNHPGKCESCDRLPYWSNVDPAVLHCGKAVGNSGANNRDTLNLTAPIVSNFRCGVAGESTTGVASLRSQTTSSDRDASYYTIKVDGGRDDEAMSRLKAFYERLKVELMVPDLGYANVGCSDCSDLAVVGPPIGSLTFVIEPDSTVVAAFTSSYHYVQESQPHELFMMTVDGTSPAPACPNPLPTGCRPRTICVQTSSCDKPYGGLCEPCN